MPRTLELVISIVAPLNWVCIVCLLPSLFYFILITIQWDWYYYYLHYIIYLIKLRQYVQEKYICSRSLSKWQRPKSESIWLLILFNIYLYFDILNNNKHDIYVCIYIYIQLNDNCYTHTHTHIYKTIIVQLLSLFNHRDCSMSGFSILPYLQEFAQIHVLWVSDTI